MFWKVNVGFIEKNHKNITRRTELTKQVMTKDLLVNVVGGKCTWNGAGRSALSTSVGMLVTSGGNPAAALVGLAGGAASYGAVCWL